MDNRWLVFNYEIEMYLGARLYNKKEIITSLIPGDALKNAVVECMVLHTRVLTEVFLSGNEPDDIKLVGLLPDWLQTEGNKKLISDLKNEYGTRGDIRSPRWKMNKLLAHATTLRGPSYDWGQVLNEMDQYIFPILRSLPDRDELPALKLLEKF